MVRGFKADKFSSAPELALIFIGAVHISVEHLSVAAFWAVL